MDGIRGLLMFGVLFTHIFYINLAIGSDHAQPWYQWPALWLQPLLYLVGPFIVVSGFCLMLPVLAAGGNLRGGLGRYFKRRALRIMPPYYIALGFSLIHTLLFRSQYAALKILGHPLRPMNLLSHLLLFYNFRPQWTVTINPAYWSLAPEWQLYILFPLVFIPIWQKFGLRTLLITAVMATSGLMLCGGRAVSNMHPWYIVLFVSGMAASVISGSADERHSRLRNTVPWGALSVALITVVGMEWLFMLIWGRVLLAHLSLPWWLYCFNELVLGSVLFSAILYWACAKETRPREQWPASLRFFRRRIPTWLGSFSYSHYLIHFPICLSVVAVIRSLHLPILLTLLLSYVVAIPLSLGLAYLFFTLVERRSIPGFRRPDEAPPAARS